MGGLALELHRRLSKHYGRLELLEDVLGQGRKVPEVWKLESLVLQKVIWDWLEEYPSFTIIKASLSVIERDGNLVTGLRSNNTSKSTFSMED